MKIEELTENLTYGEEGIYHTKNQTAISYPEEGNDNCAQLEDSSYWFKHRNQVITDSVKRFSRDQPFFDIGGGNGFVSAALQKEDIEVCLIEPGPEGAKKGKKRGLKNVICGTLEDVNFKAKSLSSVGFFDVMEHIEDDKKFLKTVTHHLKNDGFLYMTVPAFQFLWSDDDKYAGHYKRYTLKGLKSMLQEQGYEIKYASYIFSFLVIPILLFRSLPSRLGFAKDPSKSENQKSDHTQKGGILNSIMNYTFKWEINRVKKGKSISFGSSCFLVAQKSVNE